MRRVTMIAGQTIFHCHIHLMPRRRGDVEEPTGDIRNVFPGKGVAVTKPIEGGGPSPARVASNRKRF
jgi:diadenosine tetraphosphate (Ap4A) HIT family hydrolase